MNILIVTQQLIPHSGGLSTHVLDLIDALRGRDHQVELIEGGQAIEGRARRAMRYATSFGNRDRYRCSAMTAVIQRLRSLTERMLSDFKPDLVHCHDVYAGAAVADLLGQHDIPYVETVHGPALYEHRQLTERAPLHNYEQLILGCERRAFAGAAHLIAVDSGQARILRDDYDVATERITVIFNCVNVEEVRQLAGGEPPFQPRGHFFLVPRRLVPKTGVRFAIEALAKMPEQDVELVIAGPGPLREELEGLAAQLDIANRVHFLGSVPRPKLLPLFRLATGVIVPSVPTTGVIEATSLAVTEAMAAGSVPIASAIGGLAELIDDNDTGLLVPPADSAALAEAMSRLVSDDAARDALLSRCRQKVEQDYSTKAWLDRVLRVYERALTGTAAPAALQTTTT